MKSLSTEGVRDPAPSAVRSRAFVLAVLLTPPNLLWIIQAETINRPVFATLFTLFFNVTFTLFILVLVNALLKRYSPRSALTEPILLNRSISPASHVTGINVTVQMPGDTDETPVVVAGARELAERIETRSPHINVYLLVLRRSSGKSRTTTVCRPTRSPTTRRIPMASIDVRELPGTEVVTVVEGAGFFPVVVTLEGNELLAVLRGGAAHVGIKGRLEAVRSSDGGRTWSEPVTVADSWRDDRNPAVGVASDGTVVCAYTWQASYEADGTWNESLNIVDTRIVLSHDGGRTWVDDTGIELGPLEGGSPFGKIRDIDGTLYMPHWGLPDNPLMGHAEGTPKIETATYPSYFLRSTDCGRSWGDPILVCLGGSEADFLVLPSGEWLFAARTDTEEATDTFHSSDAGRTWRHTTKAADANEHPPDLTLLGNGWVLMTFGHRHPPFGVQGIVSKDGGHTWDSRRLIFDDGLARADSGYPSTVRLDDGRLVTLFYAAGEYAAGHVPTPRDACDMVDVLCRAVCCDEDSIIDALG